MKALNQEQIISLADDALDAVCLFIQKRMEQTDGGVAGMHFSGEPRERIMAELIDYIESENMYLEEEEVKKCGNCGRPVEGPNVVGKAIGCKEEDCDKAFCSLRCADSHEAEHLTPDERDAVMNYMVRHGCLFKKALRYVRAHATRKSLASLRKDRTLTLMSAVTKLLVEYGLKPNEVAVEYPGYIRVGDLNFGNSNATWGWDSQEQDGAGDSAIARDECDANMIAMWILAVALRERGVQVIEGKDNLATAMLRATKRGWVNELHKEK